jgi:hypothetical protein
MITSLIKLANGKKAVIVSVQADEIVKSLQSDGFLNIPLDKSIETLDTTDENDWEPHAELEIHLFLGNDDNEMTTMLLAASHPEHNTRFRDETGGQN